MIEGRHNDPCRRDRNPFAACETCDEIEREQLAATTVRSSALGTVALWTAGALALAFIAITALSGCNTSTRYAAAQITWSAVESSDELAATQYRNLCPRGTDYTDEQLAQCRERVRQLEQLVPIDDGHTRWLSLARLTRVVRNTAAAAVLALWAAEEGEPPRDWRQKLSCVSAAVMALVHAFDALDLPVPVVVEQAASALLTYGSRGRVQLLGECPGVDELARPTAPAPAESAPAPASTETRRDAGFEAPSVAPSGASLVLEPFTAADGGA